MDLLTTIELNIKSTLEGIVAPTSATSGYDYYTTTGTVNIEDESLSLSINTDNRMVNYVVTLDGNENNNTWSLGNSAYTNTVLFKVCARVHQDDTQGNPKFSINQKMNECLSDLKYAFGKNFTLNGKCEWIRYSRSNRVIHPSNNRIQTGDLECYFEVTYSQSMNNPNIQACR